jgi:uncharacterized protein (UPF0335 family)
MMEYVDITSAIIGLILTVFSTLSGLIVWLHLKMKKVAQDAVSAASGPQEQTVQRLGRLEGEVGVLGTDLGVMRTELRSIGDRVNKVERVMERVATQSDVGDVKRELHGLKTAFDLQMSTIAGQINMLYQAALNAPPKN